MWLGNLIGRRFVPASGRDSRPVKGLAKPGRRDRGSGSTWLVIALSILGALVGFAVLTRLGKTGQGVLVASQSVAVWEAPRDSPKDGDMLAEGSFELVNRGDAVVRITGVASDCGCTDPQITPRVIRPGQTAVAKVSALVDPYLSRELGIQVETDSKVTPRLLLRFRVVGNLRPPRLADVSGDLSFVGVSLDDGESRDLMITSVERPDGREAPSPTSDLPFIRFEIVHNDQGPVDGGFILKRRKYRVFLAKEPPSGTSVGFVTARDPWNPTERKFVNVLVQPRSSITCVPSSLRLSREKTEATLLVVSEQPTDELSLKFQGGFHAEFVQESVGESRTVHKIKVRVSRPYPSARCDGVVEVRGGDPMAKASVSLVFEKETPPDHQTIPASKEDSTR